MSSRVRYLRACAVLLVAVAVAIALQVALSGVGYAMNEVLIEYPNGTTRRATFADGMSEGRRIAYGLAVTGPLAFAFTAAACLPIASRMRSAGWLVGACTGGAIGAAASFMVYLLVGGWGPPVIVGSVSVGALTGLLHPLFLRPEISRTPPPRPARTDSGGGG